MSSFYSRRGELSGAPVLDEGIEMDALHCRAHARTAAERELASRIRWYFRPPDRLLPSQWVEKHIKLPAGRERRHGPVSFEKAPFAREVLDALVRPGIQDVLFAGPTRICKTFLLRMAFCYKVAGDPGPMLLIDSTMPKGRALVRKEFMPLVEHNDILRMRKPVGRDRHDYATGQMLFPGASLTLYGANSEAQASGDTAEVVLGNEVKDWRPPSNDTAAHIDLVRHRTESYEDTRRHLLTSTPKMEDDIFWLEMESGDMRLYFVRCPDCGKLQPMLWQDESGTQIVYRVRWNPDAKQSNGKWDLRRVMETARYVCDNPACGSPWDDAMRLNALWHKESLWVPTKEPAVVTTTSYSVNGLYGHLQANRIGELACDFLRARNEGFIANRQDFWNNRMGLPYRVNLVSLNAKRLSHLEHPTNYPGGYMRGSIPEGLQPDVSILEFDVQRGYFPWTMHVYTWAGEGYLVDHGEAANWEDLEKIQMTYRFRGAESYAIGDINYEDRRQEVKERIHRNHARGWWAADGIEFSHVRVKVDGELVYEGGKLQASGQRIRKLLISTYDFKLDLEQKLAGELKGWWIYRLPDELPGMPVDVGAIEDLAELKNQLLAEKRQPRKRPRAGLPATEFVPRSGHARNHWLDTSVYGLALFWTLRSVKTAKEKEEAARRPSGSIQVQR